MRPPGRAQIQRPHVDQRLLDRDHHQRAPDHLRALLVPERDLRRDRLILADPRDDLPRAEDHLLLRKLKDAQRAVVLAVAARRQPRRQVVAVARREGQHLDELRLRLAGQPHDRVVRLHRPGIAGVVDDRQLPLVLAVVEDRRLRHVVRGEHRRLNREDVLRIAHVLAQRRRHLSSGTNRPGKIRAYVAAIGSVASARYTVVVPS